MYGMPWHLVCIARYTKHTYHHGDVCCEYLYGFALSFP